MPSTFNYSITDAGRVDRLLRMIKENKFFFGFGKNTQWVSSSDSTINDNNPPAPALSLKEIPEPFIYKRALKVLPVVPSGCGEIPFNSCAEVTLNNKKWTPIDLDNNPIELLNLLVPTNLYISVVLSPGEFLLPSFRAIGLYANPQLKLQTQLNKIAYSPTELDSPGVLYWTSFNSPITSKPEKLTELEILLAV